MFEIDKAKFGAFIAQLRKEKGLMQKELAEKLYVSDKAVSKWERGLSIPDVTLLIPLSKILDVSVTELLECRRIPKEESLCAEQTDEVVKKVICLSDEEKPTSRKARRGILLGLCWFISRLEMQLLVILGYPQDDIQYSLSASRLIMLILGVYFCILAKERLPYYYDENKISALYDGPFRMNLPGLYINNSNLPHILRAGRIWSMAGLLMGPAIFWLLYTAAPQFSDYYLMLIAAVSAVSLIIALYVVRKKEE